MQWEEQADESMRLVDSIEMNTKHYVEIMSRAVDKVMPSPSTEVRYVIYPNIYPLRQY